MCVCEGIRADITFSLSAVNSLNYSAGFHCVPLCKFVCTCVFMHLNAHMCITLNTCGKSVSPVLCVSDGVQHCGGVCVRGCALKIVSLIKDESADD